MLKALALWLILSFFLSISATDDGFRCNCDEDGGFWSVERILECQKVSDFMIAVAYFSIPVELLYFVSCSNLPFKWVLFQFIAFIVLCGMTHLLNGWTYEPHSFQIMLSLTIFKLLTALVSFATAITLITLIPLLLQVMVRESMLRKKTWDLDREVGIIKKQKEAMLHVRMLTQEIRKSLDRHTILYTTLVELSKTLDLKNCVIWMPNTDKTEMLQTHELYKSNFSEIHDSTIPTCNPEVREIMGGSGVNILNPSSPLAVASSGGIGEQGSVAAIRMPMLMVSNFKGGTPEMVPACYAILVLVLPDGQSRFWNEQELHVVEVVADQVAVALSHASVLEESQHMRDKLVKQNQALEHAKQDALMASQARNAFQMVICDGLRRPMHSILGLLSILQDEKLSNEQQFLVNALVRTSNVLSTLITDVMDTSAKNDCQFPLEMRSFQLRSMIREVACLSKCLCVYRDYNFEIEVDKSLPNHVMGDERRVFQVILHMVGNLLNGGKGGGLLKLQIYLEGQSQGSNEKRWGRWRSSSSDAYAHINVEVGICHYGSQTEETLPEENVSFSACRKLVHLMQGDIRMISNREGFDKSMCLFLRLQLPTSVNTGISEHGESSDRSYSSSLFTGLRVLLADADDVNRAVTRKLLEKMGCIVSAVSKGYDCLGALSPASSACQIVLLDLHLPDLDGFEITMRIRKFCSRSWPLIIAMTSTDDGDMRERCLQIGVNGIIQKPASAQEISYELKRTILQTNRLLS